MNDYLLSMVKFFLLVIFENSFYGIVKLNISGKIVIYYYNILCYKIMEFLELLYDKIYGRICVNVFNKIKDMFFEELGIDELWICYLNDFFVFVNVIGVKCLVESVYFFIFGLS